MNDVMHDGLYVKKFYCVPHFWMVIFAVYPNIDGVGYVMERHIVWNEDTSKDFSFGKRLSDQGLPEEPALIKDFFLIAAKNAVDLMEHEWREKFWFKENEEIKYEITDLTQSLKQQGRWDFFEETKLFRKGLKVIMNNTRCRQLKEQLECMLAGNI